MADNKKFEEALRANLQSTIALLSQSQGYGAVSRSQPKAESTKPSEVPDPQEEAKAFDSPSQENIDEIQDLDNATVRWQLERQQIQNNKLQEEVEAIKAKTRNDIAIARGRAIDNKLRLQMATLTFKFMQYWCGFVAFIIFLYVAKHDGKPEKEVIIALLGTSTISIVGLVGFVVSGLFKAPKRDDKEN